MSAGCKTLVVLLPLLVTMLLGCGKSAPTNSGSNAPSQPPAASKSKAPPTSYLHWLGKKANCRADQRHLAHRYLESPRKRQTRATDARQTLDRTWRLLRGETNMANTASARLRPLLDDLVQEESYIEVRYLTNQPAELVLAIRLDEVRGGLWQTNLAAAMESLTSIRTSPGPTAGAVGRLKSITLRISSNWHVSGSGRLSVARREQTCCSPRCFNAFSVIAPHSR